MPNERQENYLRRPKEGKKHTYRVVDKTAAGEVERSVREQFELDQEVRLPHSANELLEATHSALEDIVRRLHRMGGSDDIAIELRERVERYLTNAEDHEPNVYAQELVENIHHPNRLRLQPERARVLHTLCELLVGELTPLLHRIAEAAKKTHVDITPDQMLKELSQGEVIVEGETVRSQQALSVFGVLRTLAPQLDIPDFTFESSQAPVHLVVEPLMQTPTTYWQEAQRFYEPIYGEISVGQMIALRSVEVSNELEQAHEATGHEAYARVQEWVQEKIDALRSVDEIESTDQRNAAFAYQMRRLRLSRGNPTDAIALCNAFEYIKQHNQEVYLQLLGLRLGRETSAMERTSQFGNVVQVAIAQELQGLDEERTDPAYSQWRQQVHGLTQLDTANPELISINKEELHRLQQEMKEQVEGDPQLIPMLATMFPILLKKLNMTPQQLLVAYQLEHTLEALHKDEWQEMVEHLKNAATPDEFIQTLREMPEELLFDEQVQEIVHQRVPNGAEYFASLPYRQQILYIRDPIASAKKDVPFSKDYHRLQELALKMALWQTATDHQLTSIAFFRDLSTSVQYIRAQTISLRLREISVHENAFQRAEAKFQSPGLENRIEAVLKAHAHIPRADWEKWHHTVERANGEKMNVHTLSLDDTRPLLDKVSDRAQGKKWIPVDHVQAALLNLLDPKAVIATGSLFFSSTAWEIMERVKGEYNIDWMGGVGLDAFAQQHSLTEPELYTFVYLTRSYSAFNDHVLKQSSAFEGEVVIPTDRFQAIFQALPAQDREDFFQYHFLTHGFQFDWKCDEKRPYQLRLLNLFETYIPDDPRYLNLKERLRIQATKADAKHYYFQAQTKEWGFVDNEPTPRTIWIDWKFTDELNRKEPS